MATKKNPPARAYRNVVEMAEEFGYPAFMDHKTTAEEKIGEAAAAFGGFAVYTNGKEVFVLTLAMPYPEPVSVQGKLTGERYDREELQRMGKAFVPQGRVWMDAEDAALVFEMLAQRIRERMRHATP